MHELVWNGCDDYLGDVLVASPVDACGRGIVFTIPDAMGVELAGAHVYLIWRHRMSGKRGCEPFACGEDGAWRVFYPAAMQECEGVVDAQVMISLPDGPAVSTRVFKVRVEPALVGAGGSEDGFTLFVDAIKRYEEGAGRIEEMLAVLDGVSVIKGEKGDPGEKGEPGEPGPAGADGAPGRDGMDGKDGADGAPGRDGVGIASVVQTATSTVDAGVNVITVTPTDGTSSDFQVRNGRAGSVVGGGSGEVGQNGVGIASVVQTARSEESGGENVITVTLTNGEESAFVVRNGTKGERGEPGLRGERGADGAPGRDGARGEKGDTGEPGAAGAPGEPGTPGAKGDKGDKGDAFTFADFTSEQLATLKGEKGDPGEPGAKGDKGDPGDAASIDLSGYVTTEQLTAAVDAAVGNLVNLEELSY